MALRGRSCNREGLMRLRCLIVDDNASFREQIRGLLAEQGLDVVGGAGSAADARRQIAELRPDVVLIDIDLGGESGLELARELGGQPGPGAVPHLILISTHEEAESPALLKPVPLFAFWGKTTCQPQLSDRCSPA